MTVAHLAPPLNYRSLFLLTVIHWIAIYLVDSIIQPLNNWGQGSMFCPLPSEFKIWASFDRYFILIADT